MDGTRIGQQALTGWRRRVGEPIAARIAQRTGLTEEGAQAVVGAAFLLVSVWYVVKTLAAAARAPRS